LFEWAEHARRAFVREPEILRQFSSGTLGLARMLEAIDTALSLLVEQGFTELDALDAFYLVTQSAVGAAVTQLRDLKMADDGHAVDDEFNGLLERRPASELVHLRRLSAAGASMSRSFDDKIVTVLAGLAVRRGEDWQDVVARLRPPPSS
jgi:Tetracyclin repressor-like, C-terminal domain